MGLIWVLVGTVGSSLVPRRPECLDLTPLTGISLFLLQWMVLALMLMREIT